MSEYVYDFEIVGSAEGKGPSLGVEVPKLEGSSDVIFRLTKGFEKKKHEVFLDISSLAQNFLFS